MNTLHNQRRNQRRGTMIILVTIALALLMAMVALAVDVGYLNNVRTQLQVSADAAALAGADALYDSDAYALSEAERFGELNVAGNTPVDIRPAQDIQFGIWDRRTFTFTPQASVDAETDAVRVTARRSAARGNPITLFFGRALGINTTEVSASAIAEAQNGFCGGFVGIDWVHVHGNSFTDSYWSEDGPYATQVPGSNGHVCSNGTITLEGGIVVNGNASTLEGELIDMSSGHPTVTGQLNYRSDPMFAPPIIVGNADTINDNANLTLTKQGDLKITGGNVNVSPGTYWLNDFSITGSGKVTL